MSSLLASVLVASIFMMSKTRLIGPKIIKYMNKIDLIQASFTVYRNVFLSGRAVVL